MSKRPQLTVGETIKFLLSCPKDFLVFCAESEYTEDEPHELVYSEERKPCTVIEVSEVHPDERHVTFGYNNENSNSQS